MEPFIYRCICAVKLTFIFCALASTSAAGALAQAEDSPALVQPGRVKQAPKNAGIYHAASGTWTRSSPEIGSFGPEIIYDNTSPSGYFSSLGIRGSTGERGRVYDSGGLPGASNGTSFATAPDRECYEVNGFEIGYCDSGSPGSSGWEFRFYEAYRACEPLNEAVIPAAGEVVLTGFPAGGGCWTITVDLTGGHEFTLSADGDPVDGSWDDDIVVDSFGFSIRYAGTEPNSSAPAGWLIAGNPRVTDPGFVYGSFGQHGEVIDGTQTYYGPASQCDERGSGYLTPDRAFYEQLDPTTLYSRCFFFGGYRNGNGCGQDVWRPYASMHMRIHASGAGCATADFEPYCVAVPNRTELKSTLVVEGSPVAADDDVTLVAYFLPSQATGYFLTSQTSGFVAQPGGSRGNLCLGGAIGRFVGPGQVKTSTNEMQIRLSTSAGEWSTQSLPHPTTPTVATAGMTSHFQLWHRDLFQGQPTSNFTNGVAVTWR